MKKLLGIVVLGLLLSFNANADEKIKDKIETLGGEQLIDEQTRS